MNNFVPDKMPDQTDSQSHPRSHQNIGVPDRTRASTSAYSPDHLSDDHQSASINNTGNSQASRPDIRYNLRQAPATTQNKMSGPPRKRQDHSGDNDNNYFEVKRVRLTDGTAILPKSETVTIREEHYLRMNEHISHLRSACSKKHRQVGEMDKRIASMGRVIRKRDTDIAEKNRIIADKSKFNNALQLVNEESQVKIHILKDDNAKLQKELNSVRTGNGWTGWLVNHGRCSTTQAAYESRIQELEQRDKAQKAELARKGQEFAAARAEFTREMREARDLSSRNTFKVPDNVILDGWKELTFKIHQFVDYHLFAYPISDLSDDAIQSYRPLCPEPAMFLTNVLLAPLLFEAGIWSCLDKLVFGVTAEGWAGKLGRDYSQSCRNIRGISSPGD